jgi:signal peptidase I
VSETAAPATDAEPTPAGAPDDEPARHRGLRSLIEWVLVIGGALAAAFVIKTFLLQAFWIPSASMSPTLVHQDRVLVNKLSYRLHDVNRGDVVVFERPPGETEPIKDLIKRVVATEGETLTVRDGAVFVDGERLDEPYLAQPRSTESDLCDFSGRVEVPADHVFVMGDNRTNSRDSRCFGPIDEDLIVGRAFVLIWPLSNFDWL